MLDSHREFKRKAEHGISSFWVALAIFVAIVAVAVVTGYCVHGR